MKPAQPTCSWTCVCKGGGALDSSQFKNVFLENLDSVQGCGLVHFDVMADGVAFIMRSISLTSAVHTTLFHMTR